MLQKGLDNTIGAREMELQQAKIRGHLIVYSFLSEASLPMPISGGKMDLKKFPNGASSTVAIF